jgi:hypothetical protein
MVCLVAFSRLSAGERLGFFASLVGPGMTTIVFGASQRFSLSIRRQEPPFETCREGSL